MLRKFGLGLIITLVLPTVVFAQSATPKVARDQSARIATIKSRSDTEIDRRIASLTSAAGRISNAAKLPADVKATFSSEIQTNITNLDSLKTKIDSDTDLATLRTDAKTIFTDFRIFAVLLPQVHELVALDIMGVNADNLSAITIKLSARVTTDADKALLADMQAKIADAKTQYAAAEAEITPLTPANFPAAKDILKDARAKIKAGTADLHSALQDAQKIRADLK